MYRDSDAAQSLHVQLLHPCVQFHWSSYVPTQVICKAATGITLQCVATAVAGACLVVRAVSGVNMYMRLGLEFISD